MDRACGYCDHFYLEDGEGNCEEFECIVEDNDTSCDMFRETPARPTPLPSHKKSMVEVAPTMVEEEVYSSPDPAEIARKIMENYHAIKRASEGQPVEDEEEEDGI